MAGAASSLPAVPGRPPLRRRVGSYLAGRTLKFYIGCLFVAVIAGAVVFANFLPFSDPFVSYRGFELDPPTWQFPFGTDEIGRDLLARIVYGGRPTLIAALLGVAIAALIGVPLGLASGLQGGLLDNVTGRFADATFALPTILIGVGLAAALGGGPVAVTTAIVIGSWPAFVRVARAGALQEKQLPYVEALRSLGAGRSRIIFRHILPNTIEPIIVQFTVAVAVAVLIESGLSFLGMGTQPPNPSWGGLLADSRRYLRTAVWYALFPGLAISMLVIGINFIADEMAAGARASFALRRAAGRRAEAPTVDDAGLAIDDLRAAFEGAAGSTPVLNGVSLHVARGEVLGVVGESGSGKSVTMFTATGLNRRQGLRVEGGAAWLHGRELVGMPERQLRDLRGSDIGMIFQNPAAALNPIMSVGRQIAEAVGNHAGGLSQAEIEGRVLKLLQQVQLPDPARVRNRYPHELSGGQRQRVVIAMAIANKPSLVIADEPTTALDVTVQAQVLDLLKRIAVRPDSSLVLITHDLGVVAESADRVAVMYYGGVVEMAPVDRLFARPSHPYTRGLLSSIPRLDRRIEVFHAIPGAPPRPGEITRGCAFVDRCELSRGRSECRSTTPPLREVAPGVRSACHFAEEVLDLPLPLGGDEEPESAPAEQGMDATPLLEARDLVVSYGNRTRNALVAVRGVDLAVQAGGSIGIVGESGCGKSSLLRALMNLPAPQGGQVLLEGTDFATMDRGRLREARRNLQIVQQDPSTALDRRMSVLETVREGLDIHRIGTSTERERRARDYLNRVGIGPELVHRLPSALSGGQQQRVAIARALVLHPRVLLLDEAFSALDLSVRAQVLNLLAELRKSLGLTYVFVSHDLSVIRSVADELAIMYLGKVVEYGPSAQVFRSPLHPYTAALLSAVPVPDPAKARGNRRIILDGDPPNPSNPPSGCAFRNRCWRSQPKCSAATPTLAGHSGGSRVACFFPLDGPAPGPVVAPSIAVNQ